MSIYTSTAMRKPKHGERCPTCGRKVPVRVKVFRGKPRRVSVNRDPEYKRWLRTRWCVIGYQVVGGECEPHAGSCPDPAHTKSGGKGMKGPDSSCIPLCRKHHDEMDHQIGREAFAKKYALDLEKVAAEHYSRYLKTKEQN